MITPSPDCQVGKHAACSGGAWDEIRDEPAPCPCLCHAPAAAPVEPPPEETAGPFDSHVIVSAQTTLKCACGVPVTSETLMGAFEEHFEHAEAATAPAEESDR